MNIKLIMKVIVLLISAQLIAFNALAKAPTS